MNPQKDESMKTEKTQYKLPDGSTLEVFAYLFAALVCHITVSVLYAVHTYLFLIQNLPILSI